MRYLQVTYETYRLPLEYGCSACKYYRKGNYDLPCSDCWTTIKVPTYISATKFELDDEDDEQEAHDDQS